MATTEGRSREQLAEISAQIDVYRFNDAQSQLMAFIRQLPRDSLELISPDLRLLIDRFHKSRRRKLMEFLDLSLKQPIVLDEYLEEAGEIVSSQTENRVGRSRGQLYSGRLAELRDYHIFQWATFYRETVGFIFKDFQISHEGASSWREDLDEVSEAFAKHAREIFERGYRFVVSSGISEEIAIVKSLSGLQRFLYLVVNFFLESRETVVGQRNSRLIWEITSSMLLGIFRGYSGANFGNVLGWDLLLSQRRGWIPALGFVTGSDALSLFQDAPRDQRVVALYGAIVPMLLALDQLSNKHRATGSLIPRLSRISAGNPPRLDLTLGPLESGSGKDVTLSCFFEGVVQDSWVLQEAYGLKAVVVVGSFVDSAREFGDSGTSGILVESGEVCFDPGNAQSLAELISAKVYEASEAGECESRSRVLVRNYAREFPLEDPDTRRMYMVERHSVKQLLEKFDQGSGVHLWCSVRRSGKTTAASNLADMSGRSVVVYQTMDHQPHQAELNLFERRVADALNSGKMLPSHFFSSVVQDCALATATVNLGQRKIVFVVDEYESLFGSLQAMTNSNADLRFLVALPLLSQMVSFASTNLLIFMGQRPDAHFILASQNQLSPLARQYGFPLFAHQQGGRESEFVHFLRRVLTTNLPFGPDFADAVYEETGGHPYLTVNMMVDFCEWLIDNHSSQDGISLDPVLLNAFTQDRLSQTALQRSPHYGFFQSMLSDYLGEKCRRQEPWLHAIAIVLKQIAIRHPRAFSCSVVSFASIAEPLGPIVRMTSNQLLASASMANFLKMKSGQVVPAIRLMARLAGSAIAKDV